MNHLDEGALISVRDGAGSVGDEHHLSTCTVCQAAYGALKLRESEVADALSSLDTSLDMEQARSAVRRRVLDEAAPVDGVRKMRRGGTRGWWSLSRAAGLLLVTAAGASALPGSPVRSWISHRLAPTIPPAAVESRATVGASSEEVAGIRLSTGGEPFSVELLGLSPGAEIRVRWGPGEEVAVQAAPGTRFTSSEGRLEALVAPGLVRVELPRAGARVSLSVGGRIYLRTSQAGVETVGPVAERRPDEIVFRVPSPS